MPNLSRRTLILLVLFGLALVYAVFTLGVAVAQEDIGYRQRRDVFMFAIALLGIASSFTWEREKSSRPESKIITWAAMALPCYALFQLLPLPVAIVGLLSPARAELVRSLEPFFGPRSFASLSIAPAETAPHVLLFSTYCIIFLSIRELVRSGRSRIWLLAAPIVIAGAAEAAMALMQFLAHGDVSPKGTYGLRNHLAGLLEMAFPMAAMYGISSLRTARHGRDSGFAIGRALGGFAVAALLLIGALTTLSRGGFAGVLVSALVISALALGRDMPPRKRVIFTALFFGLSLFALFFLTPQSLIERLSTHSSEGRVTIWREALGVIREYPLVGCGLGGFESAFLKFKASEGLFQVDYAHNDYLQYLAELGIAGFLVAATLIVLVFKRSVEIALDASELRWAGLACVGSLTAILVHSTVDFNLYVPANAAVVAWICGMAAGLRPSSPRIVSRRRAGFVEAEADA